MSHAAGAAKAAHRSGFIMRRLAIDRFIAGWMAMRIKQGMSETMGFDMPCRLFYGQGIGTFRTGVDPIGVDIENTEEEGT